MKIKDIILSKKRLIKSFEIFPPKKEGSLDTLFETIKELKNLNPDFVSVTYGAGGSTRNSTLEIADRIRNVYELEVLMHLTCVGSSKEEINLILEEAKKHNIDNILALRGDPPKGSEKFEKHKNGFSNSSELISFISQKDVFSIAGGCYPEGHCESKSKDQDVFYLQKKVENGADFFITQLFFENEILYSFLEKLQRIHVSTPVLAGIMPITNKNQIGRIVEMCGASIPNKLQNIIEKYDGEDFEKAALEFAKNQIIDLVQNKVSGIHLYTMNKAAVSKEIDKDCF